MRKIVPPLLLTLLAAVGVFAQIPEPVPTPPPIEDTDVVKISTNLIQIDVTVTNAKGDPVGDLSLDDFEIFENGKKQDITNFSYISAGVRKNEAVVKAGKTDKNKLLPPPPAARLRPDQIRRTIALVVDDLTLSFDSTYFVRRALRKFVDEQMEEGDLVAIIRTGAGIGALQQFTADKRMLYAAIEKIQWNMRGTGDIGAFSPIDSSIGGQSEESGEDDAAAESDPEADLNEFRESIFATGTLGAINYVIRGMKDLPGRKSVMLLSDGFSLFTTGQNGFANSSRVLDSLRQLIDLANRSSVVIYTIDARGLVLTGITAADNVSGLSVQQIEDRISGRRDKLFNTQEGLIYLARQTGGISLINNNDISGGIRRALDDQSYYLIGYQPDDETFDPARRRFNRLEIKVKRKDVKVRYRSGFFGVSDEQRMKAANQTPAQAIIGALTSPFGLSEINLSLNTVFRADPSYKTSLSSFLYIDMKDIKFSDAPDGKKTAAFDLMAITFGDNGIPVDQISKTYTINMNEQGYRDLLREGFVYFFSFPVEKPGAYQMRVAIRDHGSAKLGSASQFVEVPKLKKKRLTVSGLVLQNLTIREWENETNADPAAPPPAAKTNPLADTAIRRFKRGTILRYGFEIYNAKNAPGQTPRLQVQTRLFRDGKVIFEGAPQPVGMDGQTDPQVIKAAGALVLGTEMTAGDYILQIVITDELAGKKYKSATQFVQFELVE